MVINTSWLNLFRVYIPWDFLELRKKTIYIIDIFAFMVGLKKLSESIYLLKGCLGHELGFDPHVTGRRTIHFSM